MDCFVEHVNIGHERGNGEMKRYTRHGRKVPPLEGVPGPPEPWKGKLLVSPIEGRVLHVAENQVRLDVGTHEGVREGLKLFIRGGAKDWPVHLRVVSTTKEECLAGIEFNDSKLDVLPGAQVNSRP